MTPNLLFLLPSHPKFWGNRYKFQSADPAAPWRGQSEAGWILHLHAVLATWKVGPGESAWRGCPWVVAGGLAWTGEEESDGTSVAKAGEGRPKGLMGRVGVKRIEQDKGLPWPLSSGYLVG